MNPRESTKCGPLLLLTSLSTTQTQFHLKQDAAPLSFRVHVCNVVEMLCGSDIMCVCAKSV